MNRHLIVMVRAPRVGSVKTRLGSDIGYVKAWRFYRSMLSQVITPLVRDQRWATSFAVTPDKTHNKSRVWPVQVQRLAQGSGDLGQRMWRIMTMMPRGPVVIIGADIPDIRPSHINDAFRALGSHDIVYGPAADGGYWLIGMKRRPALKNIFSGVRWSTKYTLADTKTNFPSYWSLIV